MSNDEPDPPNEKPIVLDTEAVERLERFRFEDESLSPSTSYGEVIERLCEYRSLETFGDERPEGDE